MRALVVVAVLLFGSAELAASDLQEGLERSRQSIDRALRFESAIEELHEVDWSAETLSPFSATRIEIQDQGFGVKRIEAYFGGGLYVSSAFVTVVDSGNFGLIQHRIEIRFHDEDELVHERLGQFWSQSGGGEHEPLAQGFGREIRYEGANRFRAALEEELGEVGQPRVPRKLRKDFDRLMSPLTHVVVGDVCGEAGVMPFGTRLMIRLVKQERLGLLIAMLRSPNYETRILGLIGLLELDRQGVELDPSVFSVMKKVQASEAIPSTCSGCIQMDRTIDEIIEIFEGYWEFSRDQG